MDEGTELERSEELMILWDSCVKMFFYGFMKLASPYEKPPFPFLFVPSVLSRPARLRTSAAAAAAA